MTSNSTPDVRAAIESALKPHIAHRGPRIHATEDIYDRLAQIGAVPAAVESLMYAALGRLGANGLCIVAIADAIETADTINSEGIGSPAATRIRKCAEAARLAYAPVPDLPITADHVPTKAELRAAVKARSDAEERLRDYPTTSRKERPDIVDDVDRAGRYLDALIDRLPIPDAAARAGDGAT